jgi:hypothetical protein
MNNTMDIQKSGGNAHSGISVEFNGELDNDHVVESLNTTEVKELIASIGAVEESSVNLIACVLRRTHLVSFEVTYGRCLNSVEPAALWLTMARNLGVFDVEHTARTIRHMGEDAPAWKSMLAFVIIGRLRESIIWRGRTPGQENDLSDVLVCDDVRGMITWCVTCVVRLAVSFTLCQRISLVATVGREFYNGEDGTFSGRDWGYVPIVEGARSVVTVRTPPGSPFRRALARIEQGLLPA